MRKNSSRLGEEINFSHLQKKSTTPGFQFAYLLKFRDMNSLENKELNLRELLNLSSLLDGNSLVDDKLMKYFIKNPDKVLIIIDGYDEYKYGKNIANDYHKQYPNDPWQKIPVPALLSKLIHKKVLKDSVVMLSSRPGEVDELGEIHFDEYVQIHGFSPQQVTEFVEKYFRTNERMKNIVVEYVQTNPNLISFCHIPVMCFLLCVYMEWHREEKSTADLPATTTHLFSEIINTFIKNYRKNTLHSSGETTPKPNPQILLKIEEFAAKLLQDKQLVFYEEDMKANLSPQEIEILKASGLLHCSPERKGPFEIQQSFEFIHLTVQECLSAQWFVAMNKLPEEGTSGMVLQFMSGLLAREHNDEMMGKLLETVKPSDEDDHEHKLLCLKCLNEYGDRELSRKHLVPLFSLYCDSAWVYCIYQSI